jgi:hypothetical protein
MNPAKRMRAANAKTPSTMGIFLTSVSFSKAARDKSPAVDEA